MKHIFILSFLLIYTFFGTELGYTATLPIWKHITYMFQHGSIAHLCINSLSFYMLFTALQRYISPYKIAFMAISIAFTMSFLTHYSKVVVGSSGMIYAMLGIYLFLVSIGKIKYRSTAALIIGLLTIATSLIISFLQHNSAGMLHLLCLTSGTVTYATLSLLSPPSPN